MSTFDLEEREAIASAARSWWLFLLTGILWFLVAIIILRFDYTSVSAISILFGCVAIAAGVLEIGMVFISAGWWKLFYAVLAVIFIVAGIVAFIHPGNTFVALCLTRDTSFEPMPPIRPLRHSPCGRATAMRRSPRSAAGRTCRDAE